MKKRTKWVLLALIAVVAIILVVALLRGCQQDAEVEAEPDPDELPLDDSPLRPVDPSEGSGTASIPNMDSESDNGQEEDELPIITY